MKIRIKGNSVRVRITKSEVTQLCKEGVVQEVTPFISGSFTYALRSQDVSGLTADFQDNTITVVLPQELVKDWEDNNRIGFNGSVPLGDGQNLLLLVEKDFTCIEDRGEDESDNYPNPKLQH
ncbi:hypothetical protein Q4603_04125 [Zobellia galactanivorans]|uniref:Uncharacterized protein n=1 Tax=Zobellia galactanivorans (strain DSM 12802 / CCUG 47099 / CIP 106680 / NCIMB 13871 / Dsij) TaxID=63186 RepID=G0L2U2_ZOBGA|nr:MULTISPECIES: hypothetical protein [Zobellia]MBU3024615.1 hypothetical protein [Zobellia galactanivorans]MDO6807776.1 hypothetical protein [Zobellia galactanivorans]OWW25580.1 hypothetical protein B4Q04_08190 [Zobellia sp. OII3]CAZ98199.1 Conserved hypothetical protein [Zobellia galactanivorans]